MNRREENPGKLMINDKIDKKKTVPKKINDLEKVNKNPYGLNWGRV